MLAHLAYAILKALAHTQKMGLSTDLYTLKETSLDENWAGQVNKKQIVTVKI
ncbi:MAG: hypothetical protein LBI43_05375 [Streptococcaceae bacterium]|nr:hypothetical protein [Streptococcaceae bacterium]